MNRRLLALALCLVAVASQAQVPLDQVLAVRKQYGIKAPLGLATYATFTGSGVFEVRCVVRGFISGRGETLMVESPDGLKLNIRAADTPEFLQRTGTQARVFVQLNRPNIHSEPDVILLAATTEDVVGEHDLALQAEADRRAARVQSRTSRAGGGRPAALQGDVPSVEGQIGTPGRVVVNPPQIQTPVPPADVQSVVSAYAAYIRTVNSRVGSAQAEEWAGYVVRYTSEVGLDPRLLIALIVAESDFKPMTTSNKGAMGLCQLMGDEVRRFGLTDPYDPKQNIYAATRLLREGIDKYRGMGNDEWNSIVLALAGYNAGHGAVKKYGYTVPPYRETQGYVRKISNLYRQFIGSR